MNLHRRTPGACRRAFLASLLTLATVGPARAQPVGPPEDPFATTLPADSSPERRGEPRLGLIRVTEIALPGPLPGSGPRWIEGRIEIAVDGGTARVRPEAGAIAELAPAAIEPPRVDGWTADRSRRFRGRSDGWVEAERRCGRCAAGWKRDWRLRVPGASAAPPVVSGRRVFFGARDNRVYAVKRRNGHRVWSQDVGGRVNSPLASWRGAVMVKPPGKEPVLREMTVLLVVPNGGATLIVLDAEDGRKLDEIELEQGEGFWIGVPLATPDGLVLLAQQKYADAEAALVVFRLGQLETEAVAGVHYNAAQSPGNQAAP